MCYNCRYGQIMVIIEIVYAAKVKIEYSDKFTASESVKLFLFLNDFYFARTSSSQVRK